MSDGGYKARCATCGVYERCREAWGRYWEAKSDGGVGCSCPLTVAPGATAQQPETPVSTPRHPEQLELGATPTRPEKGEPWEIAHTTRGPSAGIFCTNKRRGMARARQGRLL